MNMNTRTRLLTLVVCLSAASVWTAERVWQTAVWRDVKVERPKVVFGMAARSPNDGGVRAAPPASREVRTYVIETAELRLEIKEDTTVDSRRLEVLVGEPVMFAMEKNNVYIKDAYGHEHKLKVTKREARAVTK